MNHTARTTTARGPVTARRAEEVPRGAGAARVPAILAVAAAVWLIASSFVLPFRFTATGVDARQRTAAFGVALALIGVSWLRRGRRPVGAFVAAYAVVAVALVGQSFVLGYGSTGPLAACWWNDKVTGVLMLVLCLVAVVGSVRRGPSLGNRRS